MRLIQTSKVKIIQMSFKTQQEKQLQRKNFILCRTTMKKQCDVYHSTNESEKYAERKQQREERKHTRVHTLQTTKCKLPWGKTPRGCLAEGCVGWRLIKGNLSQGMCLLFCLLQCYYACAHVFNCHQIKHFKYVQFVVVQLHSIQ